MKPLRQFVVLFIATTLMAPFMVHGFASEPPPKADRDEIYLRFSELLDTLVQDDVEKTIRENAAELIKRGKAVVSFGTTELPKDFHRDGAKALRGLDRALKSFKGAARTGNDTQLKQSLTAVRESYDELASLYLGCELPPPPL